MTGDIIGSLVLMVVLLLLSGFFSGSETALFSLGTIQRRRLERSRDGKARIVASMLAAPKRLLITILIGNMSVNTLSSSTATALCLAAFGDAGLGVAVPLMTLLLLIFGELTPKVFAVRNAEKFSLRVAGPLRFFGSVVFVLVTVMEFLTDHIIEVLAPAKRRKDPVVTVDELSVLVKMSEEAGELKRREKELVDYIFEFQETVVREVMTPRVEVDSVKRSWPVERIRAEIRSSRSARMPVFGNDLDDVDGILNAKEFLLMGGDDIKAFITEPYFIPEGKRAYDLFQDFRERAEEMAIVLDEHGGVVGLVTLEDLIEEIFGEVYDEDDEDESPISEQADGSIRFKGCANMDDVRERLDLSLDDDDDEYETLAGFCLARLGKMAKGGEEFTVDGWRLRITSIKKRRILEVEARRVSREGGGNG